jgi:hypothetical protein
VDVVYGLELGWNQLLLLLLILAWMRHAHGTTNYELRRRI